MDISTERDLFYVLESKTVGQEIEIVALRTDVIRGEGMVGSGGGAIVGEDGSGLGRIYNGIDGGTSEVRELRRYKITSKVVLEEKPESQEFNTGIRRTAARVSSENGAGTLPRAASSL